MTIKASGSLSLQEINTEFGLGTNLNAYRGVRWWTDDNTTGTFNSSNISFNEFYSKRATSPVVPGSANYTTAGTFTFTVPVHNTLVVELWGGGAAGGSTDGSSNNLNGSPGGNSNWDTSTLVANGGQGNSGQTGGAGGSGSGGTTNTTGGNGANGTAGSPGRGGNGGAGANGGAGGVGVTGGTAGNGTAPGGGGGGTCRNLRFGGTGKGGGGGGGYTTRTYSAGTYAAGSSVTVVVGAGGARHPSATILGGLGAVGRAVITWS